MTAPLDKNLRIEIGMRVLPVLASNSKIRIEVRGEDYLLKFQPSPSQRLIPLIPVGFLLFWLYGWADSETFALLEVFNPATPLGVRFFLGLWTTFWTIGGVFAFLIVISFVFRPSHESILLQPATLIWRPAYPLLAHHSKRLMVLVKSLMAIRRQWVMTFSRLEITSIRFLRVYDPEDNIPVDHLILRCGKAEYELGAELDPNDLDWLCSTLNIWMQAHG